MGDIDLIRKLLREALDDPILKARKIAEMAHEGQKYGNHPYMHHIDNVVQIANELGYSTNVIISCYLHDTLEDTNLTKDKISELFGNHIASVVYAVKDEDGINRAERKSKTYVKIASMPDAIAVKLCDRISNVRESIQGNDKLFKMYKKEQPDFEAALKNGSNQKAWDILDSLFNH